MFNHDAMKATHSITQYNHYYEITNKEQHPSPDHAGGQLRISDMSMIQLINTMGCGYKVTLKFYDRCKRTDITHDEPGYLANCSKYLHVSMVIVQTSTFPKANERD